MELKIKEFDELTTRELYEILRLRAEVFVVEQNCVCQDLDGIDYISAHVFLEEDSGVRACLRVYKLESEPSVWRIGRVVTQERKKGLGTVIMNEALRLCRRDPRGIVRVDAQRQAQGFYEKFGFHECSDTFMLDGLPHVRMERSLSEGRPRDAGDVA